MTPNMGRPKIENPKNIDVKVRIDEETAKRLDAYCSKYGIGRAEAIRQGIHLILAKEK